jgi:hypothetical protein
MRGGTTTLLAALNVLECSVIGRCMQRQTHEEFIRFLNVVENQVPANKQVQVVLDNYATHKHPKVIEWLGRHKRPPIAERYLYRRGPRHRRTRPAPASDERTNTAAVDDVHWNECRQIIGR